MAEFLAEGRGSDSDHSMIGGEIRTRAEVAHTAAGFADFVAWLTNQALEDAPRPAEHVPSTTLWWVDGSEYLGRLAIRHRLNDALRQLGGHIGYDVRPTARRLGNATAMLRAARPIAWAMGSTR